MIGFEVEGWWSEIFFLPEISLNVLQRNQCVVNLLLFILQIIPVQLILFNCWQIGAFRLKWIWNIYGLIFNGFQVTTSISSLAGWKHHSYGHP